MTVLDTFYLLFKANTEDVEKGAKRAEKAAKDLDTGLKDANETAVKMGESFGKIIDAAAEATGAYLSFSAVKRGITESAQFNSQLEIESKNLGQNAQDMLTYAAAVEQAGGSQEELYGYVEQTTKALAGAGLTMLPVGQHIENLRKSLEGLSDTQKRYYITTAFGIPLNSGMASLLLKSNEEFQKYVENGKKNARVTEESLKVSREYEDQLSQLDQSYKTIFNTLDAELLPVFSDFIKDLISVTDWFGKSTARAVAFAAGLGAIGIGLGRLAIGAVPGVLGAIGIGGGAEATAAAAAGAASTGIGLPIAAAIGLGGFLRYSRFGNLDTGASVLTGNFGERARTLYKKPDARRNIARLKKEYPDYEFRMSEIKK